MKLSFHDYLDKMRGCWNGKNIGGTLGTPFEGMRGLFDIQYYSQPLDKPLPNDDICSLYGSTRSRNTVGTSTAICWVNIGCPLSTRTVRNMALARIICGPDLFRRCPAMSAIITATAMAPES